MNEGHYVKIKPSRVSYVKLLPVQISGRIKKSGIFWITQSVERKRDSYKNNIIYIGDHEYNSISKLNLLNAQGSITRCFSARP